MGLLSNPEIGILERVDEACFELATLEYEAAIERRFNNAAPSVLSKHGLMGLPIESEYGGLGVSPLVHALAMERFGQVGMGIVTLVDVHQFLGSLLVQQYGNESQKKGYLSEASSGESIFAYALTEPEAGSDPSSMTSTFDVEDDSYIVNGSKYLISNGSIARYVIVFAKSAKTGQISAFIVDSKSKGFEVTMKLSEKLGLLTSDTALLDFHDLKVPKENILGKEGKGLSIAYSGLLNGRIGIASGCVGVIEDCLNSCIERATSRTQHGKPIGKHQLIQRHIARIASDLESARWTVYSTAILKDEYDKNTSDSELRSEMDRQSATAKLVASTNAFDAADRAVQVFGGFGYSLLSPVGRHIMDVRVARIYEGTDEIMELKIASSILGRDFEAYK